MSKTSKPTGSSFLVWPLTVGTAVALTFSNGCGSSSSNDSGAGGDGGADSSGSSGGSGSGGSSGGSGGSSGGSGGSSGSGSSSGSTVTDGGVGGVPGGVAGPGTTVSGCEIFPPDNPWNTMIDGPNVELNHAYDSNIPQGTSLHPDFGGWTQGYGIPFSVVPATQALQDISFTQYADESDPGPMGWIGTNPVTAQINMGETMYPFFTGMHIEGNPAPGGTPGSLPGDQHGIVLQQGSSGCTLYEAWNCVVVSSPPFECANGAVFDTTSNALRTLGWTSADAAGLSIFAGLVRIADVKAGAINHAIRVTFNHIAKAYILPATHAAGNDPLSDPPMGLRLRLKSSVDISSYHVESKVIMTAMKTYGLMIADIGSDWYFQGDSDDGWNGMAQDGADTIMDELIGDFGNLHGSDFEAIDSGKAITTGL
jgi:hypothetical protein